MIVTCPQCTARYALPVQRLGAGGARVKCSSCGNVWFQMPDADELGLPNEYFDVIPESVRPLPEGANLPVIHDEEEEAPDPARAAMIAGYGAAFAVFVAVFALLLLFQGAIASAWPVSNGFYALLGYEPEIPGMDLAFDSFRVRQEGEGEGKKITVTGKIVNPSEEEARIPLIRASLRDDHGAELEGWIIRAPAETLESGKDLSFSTEYPTLKDGHDLHLRFIVSEGGEPVKTVSEDGGNNPVPAPDDQAHPHAAE